MKHADRAPYRIGVRSGIDTNLFGYSRLLSAEPSEVKMHLGNRRHFCDHCQMDVIAGLLFQVVENVVAVSHRGAIAWAG